MRVSSKGQVTIPKDVRDRLGIVAGSEVSFEGAGNVVQLVKVEPAQSPEERRQAFLQWADSVAGTIDLDGMTTDEYIAMLRGPREDLDPR